MLTFWFFVGGAIGPGSGPVLFLAVVGVAQEAAVVHNEAPDLLAALGHELVVLVLFHHVVDRILDLDLRGGLRPPAAGADCPEAPQPLQPRRRRGSPAPALAGGFLLLVFHLSLSLSATEGLERYGGDGEEGFFLGGLKMAGGEGGFGANRALTGVSARRLGSARLQVQGM